MNDWALITGASAGIGAEFVRVFAAARFNLALVARNENRLKQLATELHAAHQVETRVLPKDLARRNAAADVFDSLRDLPVGVLVNNAGFGAYGPFVQTDLGCQTEMMQVNMTALVELTHLFVQPMIRRRHGRILNVASTAAFQPGPTVSVYYATKAFVYSFSYALAAELAGTGVTVTTLCPGLTRTEFQARARLRMSSRWPAMDARTVAEAGYHGLMQGRRVVVPGPRNQIASFFAKRLPPSLTSSIVRRLHAPTRDA
jgi:uncharacterized protein